MADWNTERTPTFRKQYKNIGHKRQHAVDVAVDVLGASENPADLGRYKQNKKLYAYKLSKGDRLLYKIDYNNHKVILYRVCDHKSVYGRD